MNAHRIGYKPAPAARPVLDLAIDLALCIGVAAGLVVSILQPLGAFL